MDLENQTTNDKQLMRIQEECFIGTSPLDEATTEMIRNLNKSGSFTKDEVVSLLASLRSTRREYESLRSSNKVFKRLLTASIVFIVLLLVTICSLSFAVATRTAKTRVQADGTLLANGGTMAIATDSLAHVHDMSSDDSTYCMTEAEVDAIKSEVISGKNVILELADTANESLRVEQLVPTGATFTEDSACFWLADEGKYACFENVEDASCTPRGDSGRRLQAGACTRRARRKFKDRNDPGYEKFIEKCFASLAEKYDAYGLYDLNFNLPKDKKKKRKSNG